MTAAAEEPVNMAEAIRMAQETMRGMGMPVPTEAVEAVAQQVVQQQVPRAQQPAPVAVPTLEPGNDFSSPAPKAPIDFYLDGDQFLARSRIAGGVVIGLAQLSENQSLDGHIGTIRKFLKKVLLPASYTLFIARLDGEDDWTDPATGEKREELEPIDLPQVLRVFQFLVKRYTNKEGDDAGFPTSGSSASAGGSPNAGLSSSGLVPSTVGSMPGTPT